MDAQPQAVPTMRSPERWLAVLRIAVGLWFLKALLTTLAAGIGLLLVGNYGLAVQWQGSAQQGFHYMLVVSLVVILAARAGRYWGADGWLRLRRPGSLLARLPLG